MVIPRLYAILDTSCFSSGDAWLAAAEALAAAGCQLIQYRNKSGNARAMLEQARELKRRLSSRDSVRLIMNDRVDLCLAAGFDGVHLGQDDLSVEAARRILNAGSAPSSAKAAHSEDGTLGSEAGEAEQGSLVRGNWIGVSTHNPAQLAEGDKTTADYLAIGPVFVTASKANPDPVVGLEAVRRARELTRKPLVAIGGITRVNARSVIEAGADAVAVISDLVTNPGKSAEEFLSILG
jgi:thiamine-phosphate pyrophosphorylase